MILPCQHAKFPPRGPSEIEARATIGTPFQRMSDTLASLLASGFDGPAVAYGFIASSQTSGLFVLENPGLAYLDLAIIGNAASAGENKIKVYGAIDIPGGKRASEMQVEKQFDPGTNIAPTLGAMIVPLFDPDTGDQEITFSATADIIDTEVPYYFTSGNNYVYCAGVNRVYALLTSGTGLDGSADDLILMGRFVG
jgi:hypothetical protein